MLSHVIYAHKSKERTSKATVFAYYTMCFAMTVGSVKVNTLREVLTDRLRLYSSFSVEDQSR